MTTNDNQQPPDRIWLQIGAGMDGGATWHSEPIGEPDLEEVEYVRSPMRCHHGHESPAGLWNCPVCTDPILDAVRKAQLVEEKFGTEGYTVMDAVEGLAMRMREVPGSVFVTIGRDRVESYALALDRAAELLTLLTVPQKEADHG